MEAAPFPPQLLHDTAQWAAFLGKEWVQDFPDASMDRDPRWIADFASWTTASALERGRTTRVMRKLRRKAPREYEVTYRAIVLGESFEEITRWLNERAQRHHIPLPPGRTEHYQIKDAVALFITAAEFARAYW